MRYFTNKLLQIEEKARTYFEKKPFLHAFLAGVGVILFWRGIWEIADYYKLHPILSVILGILLLGAIGLFIQTFVGNAIIIKNVKKDEQIEKRTEKEVEIIESEIEKEEITLKVLNTKIEELSNKIDNLNKN